MSPEADRPDGLRKAMANPPPVPSKNALRALRNIAFAHPTLLFGAVGSACCTFAVSCEVQRRIRLAEKVLATKRTLRSVSNGRSNNYVARMIEAAENGEDFRLDSSSARKRRRVRHHSTAVAPRPDEAGAYAWSDNAQNQLEEARKQLSQRQTDIKRGKGRKPPATLSDTGQKHISKPMQPLEDRAKEAHRHAEESRTDFSPRGGAANTKSSPESSQSRLKGAAYYAWSVDSQRRHNSASADKLKAASMQALKPRDYHVYGRAHSRHEKNTQADVGETLRDTGFAQVEGSAAACQGHEGGAEVSDRSRARNAESPPVAVPGTSAAETSGHVGKESIVAGAADDLRTTGRSSLSTGTLASTSVDANESAVPWNDIVDNERGFEDVTPTAPFEWQSPTAELVDLASENDDPLSPPSVVSDVNGADRPLDSRREKLSYFSHVYDDSLSTSAAERSLQKPARTPSAMRSPSSSWNFNGKIQALLDQGHLDRAERYYHEFYDPTRHGFFPTVSRSLVDQMLSDESTRHRALRILFSERYQPGGRGLPAERLWKRAHRYMRETCDAAPTPKQWEAQVRAILAAARTEGIELHGKVLEALSGSLCALGLVEQAEKLIESISKDYDLPRHIMLDQLLVVGYARSHDWSAVNRIMQSLQEEEIPRKRPQWYSSLFRAIFRLHLQDHSLETTYDYLVNAMGYWKLAPTRYISCTLIGACIRAGDYLHLQQWIEALRSMWPRLDIGTGSRQLAEEIDAIWQTTQVTCEHIERACSALAYGAIDDPFSEYFRAMALDYARADLWKHVSDYASLAGQAVLFEGGQRWPMVDLIKYAERCLSEDVVERGSDHLLQRARESLERQIRAFARLLEVMEGRLPEDVASMTEPADEIDAVAIPTNKFDNDQELALQKVPGALRPAFLPHLQTLWPMIAGHYVRQLVHGRSSDHAVLEHVVSTLKASGRLNEAGDLLQSMIRSPFVTGKNGEPFTAKLYELWLDVAALMNSMTHSHRAMWAILDDCRHITVSTGMLIRAAQCVDSSAAHIEAGPKKAELRYLYTRMRKIRWIQQGMAEEPPKLPRWKSWEEQMRRPPLTV